MSKVALCIKTVDAPASVRCIITGTHLIELTEEFFYTPAQLEPRATCETDNKLLQLLPYIVVQDEHDRVFRYFRGAAGTENRLHGAISIGLGGHVETMPGQQQPGAAYSADSLFAHLKEDAVREIDEEIGIKVDPKSIEFVHLVYNPTGVNEVHLGILGIARVNMGGRTELAQEEGVITQGGFINPETELYDHPELYARCEEWTKAALWYLTNQAARKRVQTARATA
jgi:predicted NUDIX family phosphoesterase